MPILNFTANYNNYPLNPAQSSTFNKFAQQNSIQQANFQTAQQTKPQTVQQSQIQANPAQSNPILNSKPDTFEKSALKNDAEILANNAQDTATKAATKTAANTAINVPAKAKNKKTKLIIGGLIGLAAVVAGGILLHKKLSVKDIQKVLPEHIDFNRADTLEDAFEFGKNTLGIKKYIGFNEGDLKVVNWVNEGLVNVNNATGGKAKMPDSVIFDVKDFLGDNVKLLDEDTLAGAVRGASSQLPNVWTKKYVKQYGDNFLFINTKFFKNPTDDLNNTLQRCVKEGIFEETKDGYNLTKYFSKNPDLIKSLKKFKDGKLDFNEQILLSNVLSAYSNAATGFVFHPAYSMKQLCKALKFNKTETKDIMDKFSKKTYKEQKRSMLSFLRKFGGKKIVLDVQTSQSPFTTIYHEMGHLQDAVDRPLASGKFKSAEKYPKELLAWLNDDKNMEIANQISPYSATGPGEFIAETFARAINGGKIPKEAKELYLKLNGPSMIFNS